MRGCEARLSDRLAVQMLIRAYPPELVERAIRATGRAGFRNRLLPPRIVVYFVLAMSLFEDQSYEHVSSQLAQGLAMSGLRQGAELATTPSTAAISRARARLGTEPLKALFAEAVTASPARAADRSGARYRRWRLRIMDGDLAVVPHSRSNAIAYSAPGGANRPAAPSARVSVLAENGSSHLLAADVSPADDFPRSPVEHLTRTLGPGDLLLADGDYARPALWRTAAATRADLLWSVPESVTLPAGEAQRDGSRLCVLRGGSRTAEGLVRVLDPARPGGGELITTLLDCDSAPADELRAVHAGRWNLKQDDVLRDRVTLPLRSRSPEMVEQEIWGHLLICSAIRRLANTGIA
ncbi:transposase domain-containing protein [Streptomyces sp. NBC_01190]|uniref:transposase domain-containing protein n=1 Tax=Streptomyces sp. NBC_01190 TaxID=2903767 RepID=UPI00386A81E4|nr:transposase domain-containing protein [Streptomyces sp. NBC_01190]